MNGFVGGIVQILAKTSVSSWWYNLSPNTTLTLPPPIAVHAIMFITRGSWYSPCGCSLQHSLNNHLHLPFHLLNYRGLAMGTRTTTWDAKNKEWQLEILIMLASPLPKPPGPINPIIVPSAPVKLLMIHLCFLYNQASTPLWTIALEK